MASNTNAFTYTINPYGSGPDENNLVHESSPSWVLTFVCWENRDLSREPGITSESGPDKTLLLTRDPLVVENDCIRVNVIDNKGTLTPSMTASLVMTDINYETYVAPGDFVIVNMLNWPSESRRVADKARAKKAINGPKDGFKGLFKVQSVRKSIKTDPSSGTKVLVFNITGFAFTEFNNTIYFNPNLVLAAEKQNILLFASNLGQDWILQVSKGGINTVQDVLTFLIRSFLGTGITDNGLKDQRPNLTPNVHFYIPGLVGSLLGVSGAESAKDIYNYLFGIQKYTAHSTSSLSDGMNPNISSQPFNRFYYTEEPCPGNSIVKPEYWNQVTAWSILNQYTNSPLNELYTCFRLSPEGSVMPTLVFRQIPFTTDVFPTGIFTHNDVDLNNVYVTRFMNLPRWKIAPAMVTDLDIGRDEAARVNYLQYYSRSVVDETGISTTFETSLGNYAYDINDVLRSGLRPIVIQNNFDDVALIEKKPIFRSPIWAKIVGDAYIGGHLKLNGTLECVGIVDPIAVGDNLEFDGVVYHIEQINHSAAISVTDGKKIFRTTINVSNGVSIQSGINGMRYAEMTYTNAYTDRQVDYKNNQILPGVSESQDTVYRTLNPDVPDSGKQPGNAPFPQPGKAKKGESGG